MTETILVDANVIIRFLLNDSPKLSKEAKSIFSKAQDGVFNIYIDEVVLAEVIWTLSSFYKIKKEEIAYQLEKLLTQDWIKNPRKSLILKSLSLFKSHNLHYIDCWQLVISGSLNIPLETFDAKLKKLKHK